MNYKAIHRKYLGILSRLPCPLLSLELSCVHRQIETKAAVVAGVYEVTVHHDNRILPNVREGYCKQWALVVGLVHVGENNRRKVTPKTKI